MMSKSTQNSQLVEKHTQLANEAKGHAEEALHVLQEVVQPKLEEGGEGLSLLHLKNIIMVEYLSDLTYILLRKSSGKSISGNQAIHRIVENRTVLEKLRPMEKKLKYQVEKYVKLAGQNGGIRPDDPLHFKPNLEDLEQSEEEEEGSGRNKYVVPKHVPTLCEDDLTAGEVEKEKESKQRRKTLSKAIVEDLRRQYTDAPDEDFNHSDTMKAKHIQQMKERTRYEEEHYTRLPTMSKKEKHSRKRSMTTMGVLGDELTYFGSNNFFNEGDAESRGKKRRTVKSKGSARKKFKKRM